MAHSCDKIHVLATSCKIDQLVVTTTRSELTNYTAEHHWKTQTHLFNYYKIDPDGPLSVNLCSHAVCREWVSVTNEKREMTCVVSPHLPEQIISMTSQSIHLLAQPLCILFLSLSIYLIEIVVVHEFGKTNLEVTLSIMKVEDSLIVCIRRLS